MTETRFVAFLRGMNVGGRRITNDELCRRFEALGFRAARAFLASGNVVFDTEESSPRRLQARIEEGLRDELGYDVPVFLRDGDRIRSIAACRPFPAEILGEAGRKLQVALIAEEPPDAEREAVLEHHSDDDPLVFEGRELYWAPRLGVGKSALDWKAIGRILGTVTVRTHRTIRRIEARYF